MIKYILNTLLPHRCLRCEKILGAHDGLCPTCWSEIQFITSPFCYQCGLPLEVDMGRGAICAICAKGEQSFSRARSLFVYNDASRDLILKFKHGDAQHGASLYAKWMSKAGSGLTEFADIIVPIPLHWTRLFRRTYNQAHLLAKEIARNTPHAAYRPTLLRRIKATKSQGHLNQNQRQVNLQGSIILDKRQKNTIKGKKILLVDDVMTSGATLNTCAKVLLLNGAASVDAITLGRVTRS